MLCIRLFVVFNVCHIFFGLSRRRRQLVYADGEFVTFFYILFIFYYSIVFLTHSINYVTIAMHVHYDVEHVYITEDLIRGIR